MGGKVLIVDDQECIREVLAECLEFGGYEACVASNGDEGLRQLYEHHPDLVVTDMRMPGMDGYEFSRLVRQASDVPIIMLSGMGDSSDEEVSPSSVDAFLAKPVQMMDFLDMIEATIEKNQAYRMAEMQSVS